jgi:hypothetical protein
LFLEQHKNCRRAYSLSFTRLNVVPNEEIEAIYDLPVAVYFRKAIEQALNHYNFAPCYSENAIHSLIYVTSCRALNIEQ